MREKRVNLLVLICSLVVATCASVSYCSVTSFKVDGYATILCAAIPLLLGGHISPASGATVWIPSEEAIDTDGSVNDEFLEVSHVFGRPETKIVKPKEGDEITELPVPFVSMKKEWEIYQKIQNSKRNKNKAGVKEAEDEDEHADDDGSSEEEEEDEAENVDSPGENYDGEAEDGEEEEDHDEDDDRDDDAEGRSSLQPSSTSEVARSSAKSIYPKFVSKKNEPLPLAFFGQENHDDDESDFLKAERRVFKKPKSNKKKASDEEDDNEEDDVSGSVEDAASLEDYADYAADDENNENEGGGQRPIHNAQSQPSQNPGTRFEDIPLAIREMILNDLASQNNGSGFSPNLTPQVTQGVPQGRPQGAPQGVPQNAPVKQEQDDDASDEENSSEEEDDNNAAEVIRGNHPNADPTPPAIRPTPKQTKGDDDEEDEVYDDGGKGKGKKGKKKKGKKGKGGWGWKPQGWGHVHIPTGWGHKEEKGWGWDPSKHDGVLEQMVRGSTWERVLKYYHWKRDQAIKEEGHHDDHHDHHHHGGHHDGPFGHGPHEEHHHDDHYHHKPTGIKKIVNKAFKGSFWERAFHTYAKYKEEQAKNPKKPAVIDLDTHHGLDVKMH